MSACSLSRSIARIRRMSSTASSRLRRTSPPRPVAIPPPCGCTPARQRWGRVPPAASPPFDIAQRGWNDRSASEGADGGGGMFTGVKVFSATKAKEREDLGEQVTRWLRANADLEIVDRTVMQSSDNEFHCLTVVLFYKPKNGPPKP